MSFNVAIDGPAGAGKSTIARAVAKKKGFIYVDTGAMYRAMALFMLREGVEPTDAAVIADKCKEADITIQYVDGEQVVLLNGENVNAYLRTEEVGNMASNNFCHGSGAPGISSNSCIVLQLVTKFSIVSACSAQKCLPHIVSTRGNVWISR